MRAPDYDIVILDIMGVRGFELLEIAVKKKLKVVMLTAHALNPEALQRSYEMKARAYLPKDKLGEINSYLEDVLNSRLRIRAGSACIKNCVVSSMKHLV